MSREQDTMERCANNAAMDLVGDLQMCPITEAFDKSVLHITRAITKATEDVRSDLAQSQAQVEGMENQNTRMRLTLALALDNLRNVLHHLHAEQKISPDARHAINVIKDVLESTPPSNWLQEKCKPLVEALDHACIASCNCLTKTPDEQYHAESCDYKIYRKALQHAAKERMM